MADFYTNSQNLFQSGIDSVKQTPNLMYFIVAAILLIVGVLLYLKYRPQSSDIVVMGPYQLGKPSNKQPWNSLLTDEQVSKVIGNNITCSFFVYMDEVNTERIPIGSPDGDYRFQYLAILGGSVGIKMDPIHQKVLVDIVPTPYPGQTRQWTNIEVKDVRIAKWNQITVSVEGRTVDIYVNGHLQTSALLDNVPFSQFTGIWLNTSPDFVGQAGMFQLWPQRRTAVQILETYKRSTDIRGKPRIPAVDIAWSSILNNFCDTTGICGFRFNTGALEYIDYEFA